MKELKICLGEKTGAAPQAHRLFNGEVELKACTRSLCVQVRVAVSARSSRCAAVQSILC